MRGEYKYFKLEKRQETAIDKHIHAMMRNGVLTQEYYNTVKTNKSEDIIHESVHSAKMHTTEKSER